VNRPESFRETIGNNGLFVFLMIINRNRKRLRAETRL